MMSSLNFLPVLYAIVEPTIGLVVTKTMGYADTPEDFIALRYDPEIGPDQLTQQPSEFDQRSWARLNDGPAPPQVFSSSKTQPVTRVMIRMVAGPAMMDVFIVGDENDIGLKAQVVARLVPSAEGRGEEVLYRALAAAVELPGWGEEADQHGIRVCLWMMAAAVERLIGPVNADATIVDGYVKIAERGASL